MVSTSPDNRGSTVAEKFVQISREFFVNYNRSYCAKDAMFLIGRKTSPTVRDLRAFSCVLL